MADPKILPGVKPGQDSVLKTYKNSIATRAAKQREARTKVPDLSVAQEQYKPGKDAPMTIAQMGEAQRNLEAPVPGLSPATVAGLKALAEQTKAQKTETRMEAQEAPKPESKPSDKTPDDLKRKEVDARLRELDDLEFDRVVRSIANDIINNDKEREAVKLRVKEIDLAEGLASGEFFQDVPIATGFTVRFRTVSPMENQSIRLLLFAWVDKDARMENISGELYSLMLAVASVVRINTKEYPSHVVNNAFDEEVFKSKFDQMCRFAMPMIHAIGTHGAWFDQRVRALFTSENLKNG